MLRLFSRLSVHAPRRVLAVGLVILAIAVFLSTMSIGVLKSDGFDTPHAGSILAQNELQDRFGGSPDLLFLLTSKTGNIDDAASAIKGEQLTKAVSSDSQLDNVQSYWPTHIQSLKSKDDASALVMVHVKGSTDNAATYSKQIIKRLSVSDSNVTIRAGGLQAINNELTDQVTKDLTIAESIAVPLTLILLVLAFGAVVAALLPLVIGVCAIFGTLAALWIISQFTDVSIYALNLTTAMGLGLGVDYALLMVSRFREELATGAEVGPAVRITLLKAGKTIVFSAGTVALALAALLVFPPYFLRSFAYAGIAVVLIAMFAAIVILPAILMVLGDKVNAGRLPGFKLNGAESKFWHNLAARVTRRPIICAVPLLAVMALLALPVLHIKFASPDDRTLPPSFQSHQVGDALRTEFTTDDNAAMYAVLTGQPSDANLVSYAQSISKVFDVSSVTGSVGTFADGKLTQPPTAMSARYSTTGSTYLSIISEANFANESAQNVVGKIRSLTPPPSASMHLGGPAALLVDEKRAISDHLPAAITWIVVSTFVLLFLYTGSLVLPLKAIVLNGITLAAVMGTMAWIFQQGHLSGVLDFTARPLDTSMPVLLFCVAFGLSMDYEIFLLSRIKEAHDSGASNVDSVIQGLGRTGRIVTTAAGLLTVSFLAFGTSRVVFLQMFGVGTAMAILLDATLVRGVLVPAFMRLAGGANWWAPKSLKRLHEKIGLSDQ